MSDNNIYIKQANNKEGYYGDESSTKPTRSVGTAKSFKRVLEKEREKDDETDEQKVSERDRKEKSSEELADSSYVGSKKTVSLFDLSQHAKTENPTKMEPHSNQAASDEVATEGAVEANAPVTPETTTKLKKPGESIYDSFAMASKSNEKNAEAPPTPAALFAKTEKKEESLVSKKTLEELIEKREELLVSKKTSEELPEILAPIMSSHMKENVTNPFVPEQADLATINPQGFVQPVTNAQFSSSNVSGEKALPPTTNIYLLVEQMIKHLSVMTVGDKHETTVTLQQPPLFAGAQLQITGFESARGELNVSFANLTVPAQQLLAQQQQNLLQALELRGYHVHIFTASTYNEQPIITTGSANDQRRQGEQGQEQGRSGGQRRDQEEGEA